ncbi:hypothetical protein CHCC20375_3784 [Bacillus licheniformis]|nr:hypothetical protein CHCC20375_3784 [Bacillus licheniformis]
MFTQNVERRIFYIQSKSMKRVDTLDDIRDSLYAESFL